MEEKREKERGEMRDEEKRHKKTEEPTLSTTGRRLCILRQSLSSEVYYYLFDDRRRMWATSPRCTFPLISDNPPKEQKSSRSHARSQIHPEFARRNVHTGTHGRETQRYDWSWSNTRKKKMPETRRSHNFRPVFYHFHTVNKRWFHFSSTIHRDP